MDRFVANHETGLWDWYKDDYLVKAGLTLEEAIEIMTGTAEEKK